MTEKINTVKELQESLAAEAKKQAQEAINSIFENITASDINTLPEKIFVSNFLSLFHGDIVDENKRLVLTQHWVGIAGGPSQEVSIVDDNGKELYRVPPIFNSSAVNIIENGRMSMLDIVKLSESDDFKPRATLNLTNNLNLKQKELLVNSEQSKKETIDNLNKIFTKYKLPLFGTKESTVTKEVVEDDIEYEE